MPDEPPITQQAQGSYIAQATHGGTATVQVVLPPVPVQEQNRVRMLSRLRYRYDEEWEQSLEGAGLLTLGLVSKPDAVLHHTGLLFLSPQQPERPLPPGTSITQVYEQAGQELLILGEPGAGKSTLLLNLARRLVEHAELDAAQPLPVIIPLSTWAVKQQPLTDWLSEQLTQLYDVPRRLSHSWVQTDQLLLLLDGFDEVPQEARVACIKAIAAYRQEHLVPIVICSRRTEFEEIPRQQRLVMQSAVVVQPLTQEQVGVYLLQGGEAFSALQTVLHSNPVLQELVTTPLMLHILTLTYTGSKARDLPQGGSPKEQQRRIFANYIERMIERRSNRISFPLQRIIPWLSWLARQMQQQSQSIFYLEQMQPTWLSGNQMLGVYDWLAVRLPGMLMGVLLSLTINAFIFGSFNLIPNILLGGLLGGLLSEGSIPRRPAVSGGKARSALGSRLLQSRAIGGDEWLLIGALIGLGSGLSYGLSSGHSFGSGGYSLGLSYGLNAGLIFGLNAGLCSILLQFLLGKNNTTGARSQMPPLAREAIWRRLVRRREVRNGLLVGLLVWLSYGLSYMLLAGLSYGLGLIELSEGLSFGVSFGLSFGLITGVLSVLLIGRSAAVQPTDLLVWSWRSLGKSLFSKSHASTTMQITVLTGLSFGLIGLVGGQPVRLYGLLVWLSYGLSYGLFSGLSFGLSYGLLLGLIQGVSSATIEDQQRVVPNQGIRRSALNGLMLGLISTVIVGLLCWLNKGLDAGLNVGLLVWLSYGLSALSYGLSAGLGAGLGAGLLAGLSAGLLVGLLKGGLASLRHYVLRFLLWRGGAMPWHYVRFLDEAAGCILLRRVGGGYSFVHRLILDYFASLDTPLTAPEHHLNLSGPLQDCYQPETRSSPFRGRFFLTLKGDSVPSPQVSQTGGFTQVIQSKKASTIGLMVIVSVYLVALLSSGIFYLYLTRGANTGSTNPSISTSTPAATPSPCLELVSKLTDTSSAPSAVTFNNTSHTYIQAPPMTINTNKVYCAGINTNRGLMVLELDPQLAPNTVNNFVFLAQHHFYDGLIFHRVVPNFIIQTGDPKGNGTGGPGYKFNDEPVKGDYTAGTVAMANAGPNTNGSQFFICTADDKKVIEKRYNLFGHVVKGLDVAQRIQGPGDTPASKQITPDIIDHLVVVVAP